MASPGDFKQAVMQSAAVATGNGTTMAVQDGNGIFKIAAIQIVGITTATITFEVTIDGTNWVAIKFIGVTSGTAATTATADGIYVADVTGMAQLRARISAWTSGAITVTGVLSAY